MNKVIEFISNIPMDDVKAIVCELKEMSAVGVLVSDGITRKTIKDLSLATGISYHDSQNIVIESVLRRAAYAYCNIN